MIESFWEQVNGAELRQGDYLLSCPVPILSPVPGGKEEVIVQVYNLMVMTQSCDLANAKAEFVALCPVYLLSEFEQANPQFARKGEWENVRKGRIEGLYLLGSLSEPANNRLALVVDFREIYSLPFTFLGQLAEAQKGRWRLKSPYLEHFSQAFARFFMRVGLPSNIPPFK
ncbi:MAG: hypothetical protein ACREBD_28390 [Blastocatellia bacterium]